MFSKNEALCYQQRMLTDIITDQKNHLHQLQRKKNKDPEAKLPAWQTLLRRRPESKDLFLQKTMMAFLNSKRRALGLLIAGRKDPKV